MWARDNSRDLDLGSATYAHSRGLYTLGRTPATCTRHCGGHERQRQLQRRWSKPVTVGVSLSSGVSGEHLATGRDGAAGVNPGAVSVGDGKREMTTAATTVNGRDSTAAGAEPLVEQVATALAQRCGVRGGDLVREGDGESHTAAVP